MVTKKPKYDFSNEIWAGIGNRNYWNAGFDTTGPIADSGFAYRFIFEQSAKDYWREYGEFKSYIVAPSISYKGDDYRIDLAYTHSEYTDPFDRGQYMVVNKSAAYRAWDSKFLLSDPKKRLDEKFSESSGKIDTVDVGLEKNIGENWLFRANYALTRSMLDYSQIRARDFNPATGVIERENTSFRNFEHRTHAGGVNLNGLFVSSFSSSLTISLNCGCVFSPVPTAVPPMASSQRYFTASFTKSSLLASMCA